MTSDIVKAPQPYRPLDRRTIAHAVPLKCPACVNLDKGSHVGVSELARYVKYRDGSDRIIVWTSRRGGGKRSRRDRIRQLHLSGAPWDLQDLVSTFGWKADDGEEWANTPDRIMLGPGPDLIGRELGPNEDVFVPCRRMHDGAPGGIRVSRVRVIEQLRRLLEVS